MANKQLKFMTIIIPCKDVDDFFAKSPELLDDFNRISDAYAQYRTNQGKKRFNEYIIVNQDELYADKIWKIIIDEESRKEDK